MGTIKRQGVELLARIALSGIAVAGKSSKEFSLTGIPFNNCSENQERFFVESFYDCSLIGITWGYSG